MVAVPRPLPLPSVLTSEYSRHVSDCPVLRKTSLMVSSSLPTGPVSVVKDGPESVNADRGRRVVPQRVGRGGLQLRYGRDQRRQPPLITMPLQVPCIRAHPVPGQLGQPPRCHARVQLHPRQPRPDDLRDPFQRLDHLRARRPRRPGPPPLQLRHPRTRRHRQQRVQREPLRPGQWNSAACSISHSRCVAASRSRATSRASQDTPGSSTSRSRSHPTASAKIAFGPSPVTYARTRPCHTGTRASPRLSTPAIFTRCQQPPEDRLPPATRWPASHPVTPSARPGMTHRDEQSMRRRIKAPIPTMRSVVNDPGSVLRRRRSADYGA
jgi:hypothetical protein